MFASDAPYGDVGLRITLTANRRSGETPEHRHLTDVCQCVGNSPLKQSLLGTFDRLVRCQICVEGGKRAEESINCRVPGVRACIVPGFDPLRLGQRPVEQVSDMRKDFDRGS